MVTAVSRPSARSASLTRSRLVAHPHRLQCRVPGADEAHGDVLKGRPEPIGPRELVCRTPMRRMPRRDAADEQHQERPDGPPTSSRVAARRELLAVDHQCREQGGGYQGLLDIQTLEHVERDAATQRVRRLPARRAACAGCSHARPGGAAPR